MTPQALQNKPEFFDWMREYIDAFDVLSATRTYGMGPSPISLSEMLAYLSIYGSDDPHRLIRYVLKMDSAYLAAHTEKAKRESKDGGSGSQ